MPGPTPGARVASNRRGAPASCSATTAGAATAARAATAAGATPGATAAANAAARAPDGRANVGACARGPTFARGPTRALRTGAGRPTHNPRAKTGLGGVALALGGPFTLSDLARYTVQVDQ